MRIKKQASIMGYLKPHIGFLILALFFALLQVAGLLTAPIFIGKAIDYCLGKNQVQFEKVLFYILCLSASIACASVFQYLSSFTASKAARKTICDIRQDAFKKLNRTPLNYIDGLNRGDTINRITLDAERISDGLIQGFTQMFSGIATILGTLVLMLNLNLFIGLAVALLTPLSVALAIIVAKFGHKMLSRQASFEGELSGLTEEYITAQKVIKLYNYTDECQDRFDIKNDGIKKYGTSANFIAAMINPTSRLINGFVYLAVCMIGASFIIGGTHGLTVGGLSIFLSYAMQYAKPFNEITAVVTEMQTALVSSGRLLDILRQDNEKDESRLPVLKDIRGDVRFDNVSFSYSSSPFITDFNLDAISGKRVALVGSTGCGKTTLINLLMRFYEIDGGCISIDNTSTRDISRDSVRSNIGMVLQDTWLFMGTAKQNIAYGKPDATLEEVIAAAKKAKIHGFISRLKDGYDTVLEPYSLSQGQVQLICIARVFLTLPPIVVLDEATSSIDARTEIKIQSALKEMTVGHTSIIIAHRLSTIKESDLILVMEKGKIVESGSHDDLVHLDGYYNKLLKARDSQ